MRGRLTLISHAATAAQRRAAFPMDEGVEQSEIAKIANLNWCLPRAQQVFSGPERRVQETARATGLTASISMDLRDWDYGDWRGRNLDDLQPEDPQGVAAWLTDPYANPNRGETLGALLTRVEHWIGELKNSGHTIAVTHPAFIRAAVIHALGAAIQVFWRIEIAPFTVTDLRFNGKVWSVRSTACTLRTSD